MAGSPDGTRRIDEREEEYARELRLVGAGAVARLVASGIAALAALAAIAVTFRLLGTSRYGVLAFALSVVGLLPDLGRLGISAGTIREISSAKSTEDVEAVRSIARGTYTATMFIGALGAAIVVGVVMIAVDQVPIDARSTIALGLGVVVVGTQFAVATSSIARGLGRVVAVEAPHALQSIGRLVAVGVLAALGLDTLGAVTAAYALVAVVTGLAAVALGARILGEGAGVFRPALSSALRLGRRSLPFAVTGLAGFVIARFDVAVMGFVRASDEVGAYDPVLRAMERLLTLVPLLFAVQGFGAATRMLAGGDARRAGDLYHRLSKLGYVLSLPAVLVLLAFPETVLRLLYGPSFPLNPSWVWVLLVGFVVAIAFGMNGLFLGGTGRAREIAVTGVLSLVAMVVSAVVLVPAFGGLGAAAATSIALVVLNVTTAWALHRTVGIAPFRADLGRTLALSVLPAALLVVVRTTLGPTEVWQAIAWSLGAWGAWVALLAVTGSLTGSDWRPLLSALRPRNQGQAV